jgi:chromosomal replication initiator protein
MNPYIIPGLSIYPAQAPPRISQTNKIKTIICNYLHVEEEKLQHKTRKREIVYARQLSMFFILKYTNYTLAEVGEMFGGRDYTTVIHSRDTIKDRLDVEEEVQNDVKLLNDLIQPRRRITDLQTN